MLDPSLFIHGVPGLDEALPVDVYAELTDTMNESVIRDIQAKRLLGVVHKGEWYAEAPAFCEDKLRRIWKTRQSRNQEKRQEERGHQNHQSSTPPPTKENNPDLRFAKVLGLNGRVTTEDVKRRWKELTVQYHPDKVAHLGPKLREVAEQEMKAINEAYDHFRAKYHI
jgi:hypothetical protein